MCQEKVSFLCKFQQYKGLVLTFSLQLNCKWRYKKSKLNYNSLPELPSSVAQNIPQEICLKFAIVGVPCQWNIVIVIFNDYCSSKECQIEHKLCWSQLQLSQTALRTMCNVKLNGQGILFFLKMNCQIVWPVFLYMQWLYKNASKWPCIMMFRFFVLNQHFVQLCCLHDFAGLFGIDIVVDIECQIKKAKFWLQVLWTVSNLPSGVLNMYMIYGFFFLHILKHLLSTE